MQGGGPVEGSRWFESFGGVGRAGEVAVDRIDDQATVDWERIAQVELGRVGSAELEERGRPIHLNPSGVGSCCVRNAEVSKGTEDARGSGWTPDASEADEMGVDLGSGGEGEWVGAGFGLGEPGDGAGDKVKANDQRSLVPGVESEQLGLQVAGAVAFGKEDAKLAAGDGKGVEGVDGINQLGGVGVESGVKHESKGGFFASEEASGWEAHEGGVGMVVGDAGEGVDGVCGVVGEDHVLRVRGEDLGADAHLTVAEDVLVGDEMGAAKIFGEGDDDGGVELVEVGVSKDRGLGSVGGPVVGNDDGIEVERSGGTTVLEDGEALLGVGPEGETAGDVGVDLAQTHDLGK